MSDNKTELRDPKLRVMPVDDTEEQKALRDNNCYNGIPDLKSATLKMELTPEQKGEIGKIYADVNYFAKNYVHINSVEHGVVLFDTYPFQEQMLDTIYNNRFTISMLPRQSGKCVVGGTKITVRNKHTGEIREMTMQELMQDTEAKNGRN